MKRNYFMVSKFMVLGALTLFTLTACSSGVLDDPEVVMDKAKQAIVKVTTGHVDVSASMEGDNGAEDMTFLGDLELTFDKSDLEDQKADLHLDISGNMQVDEKTIGGSLDFNFITLSKAYYVMLNKIETSDDSLKEMEPFINLYLGKWLRIEDTIIPEDIREFQGQDEAMKLKQKQLEDLFVETELFTVSKEYGIEKLNGQSAYHYGLEVNINGFKDYITKASVIDGRELTAQEVEESVKILSYVKEIELYIDTDDYYVLKAVLLFSGEALVETGANLNVEIVVEGSDYNKSVKIEAPKDAEDFNPLSLMMGFGNEELDINLMEEEDVAEEIVKDPVEEVTE